MTKLLYIKANPKPSAESKTFQIAGAFVKAYQKHDAKAEITTLDLYQENIRFLSLNDLNDLAAPRTKVGKSHPVLKYAYQFAEADKYVIAEPMWNLSIPAILKAYIDYVSVSGVTFQYTQQGPVGLLRNKKALHISTRGGQYSEGPFAQFEMGDRYLRAIFAFFGITDFSGIFADDLEVAGKDINAIMAQAIKEAEAMAQIF